MDASDTLVVALGAAAVGVGIYLHVRGLLTRAANMRALTALGFRSKRLLPWMPHSKLLWHIDDKMGVVLERHESTGDTGVFQYTRVAFFGQSCIPTEAWEGADNLMRGGDFHTRKGGFLVAFEHNEDVMSTSRTFAELLQSWRCDFAAMMARSTELPQGGVCGGCGMSAASYRPDQRARCGCGAVYHLQCAEWLNGECVRWGCLRASTQEQPSRLLESLHRSLPR